MYEHANHVAGSRKGLAYLAWPLRSLVLLEVVCVDALWVHLCGGRVVCVTCDACQRVYYAQEPINEAEKDCSGCTSPGCGTWGVSVGSTAR